MNEITSRIFNLSLIIKFIDGILDVIGGFIITLFPLSISKATYFIFASELGEDPTDYLSNHAISIVQKLSLTTEHFLSLYLIFHGIIKILIVTSIKGKSIKGHLLSMVLLIGFIVYQISQYPLIHSPYLLFTILIDLLILVYVIYNLKDFIKTK